MIIGLLATISLLLFQIERNTRKIRELTFWVGSETQNCWNILIEIRNNQR